MDDTTHRAIAVDQFNRTWELLDQGDARTADEDLAMLLAAATSRWHWGQLGDPRAAATGDWQVAHVLARLGAGELSLRFARRCLEAVVADEATGWRLASAHEGVARAHAAAGDAAGRAAHVEAALAALADEPDEDDRALVRAQVDDVPEVA